MIFSHAGVKSMDLEFVPEITHSKYDFVVGSPPRFFIFYIKYIWYFLLRKFYYVY